MRGTKTITAGLAELVRILAYVKKPGLTMAEIIEKAGPEHKTTIGKVVANARIRDAVLVAPPGGTRTEPAFVLAPNTLERYKDLSKLTIIDGAMGKKKGRPKKIPQTIPSKPPVKPREEALPILNISLEAHNLTEYVSQVVTQNSQYREVLASVYNTIGKFLYPNQSPSTGLSPESSTTTKKE